MLNLNSGFQETFQKGRKIAVILLLPDRDGTSSIPHSRKNAKRLERNIKEGNGNIIFNRFLLSVCKGIPN